MRKDTSKESSWYDLVYVIKHDLKKSNQFVPVVYIMHIFVAEI